MYFHHVLTFTGPEDSPQQLTSNHSTTSIIFEWQPPTIPNGIIDRYIFSVSTASTVRTQVLSGDQRTTTIDGFNPYQFYSVSVTAANFVNRFLVNGPTTRIEGITLADSEFFLHLM